MYQDHFQGDMKFPVDTNGDVFRWLSDTILKHGVVALGYTEPSGHLAPVESMLESYEF